MSRYEFKVVPAPRRARKLTGLTKDQDRFCATVTDVMTDMGLEGWDFVGAETLPVEERRFGLFRGESSRSCLVFRREIARLDVQPPKVEPKRIAKTEETPRSARPEAVATLAQRRIRARAPLALPAPDGGAGAAETGLSALEKAVAQGFERA